MNTFDDMDVELTGGNSAKHFTTRTMKITDNKVIKQLPSLITLLVDYAYKNTIKKYGFCFNAKFTLIIIRDPVLFGGHS